MSVCDVCGKKYAGGYEVTSIKTGGLVRYCPACYARKQAGEFEAVHDGKEAPAVTDRQTPAGGEGAGK